MRVAYLLCSGAGLQARGCQLQEMSSQSEQQKVAGEGQSGGSPDRGWHGKPSGPSYGVCGGSQDY